MNTFRNKQFKNELDPKYAFYDCLRSCEIKSNSEKSLEECVENCEPSPVPKNLDGKKYDSPNAGISEAIFAYISGIKLGGKSKYKNEIIEKPIINATGDSCTKEKIKLICQLILRLQFLWIIIFILIFLLSPM